MSQEVSYYCGACRKYRYVSVKSSKHLDVVSQSSNGLREISDIHYCVDGTLSINNLHVDHNYTVRSFSLMELPESKRHAMRLPGIPQPKQQIDLNTYRINRMTEDGGYRIRLIDHQLRVNLNIGEVKKDEQHELHLTSEGGKIELFYFPSNIPLRKYNRAWFQKMVNILEKLPPTQLGLFIEALRFVYRHNDQMPDMFGIEQLKTLLSSHKTKYKIIPHSYKAVRNIVNKYGSDKKETIQTLLQLLKKQSGQTLRDLQIQMKEDLIYLIFLMVILELEGVIEMERE